MAVWRAKTVLFVEDDPDIRFAVTHFLNRRGFRVLEAETCAAARTLFHESRPDVVLTDYRLPDGDALELVSEFRQATPVPILILTGHGTIELAIQAVKKGAHTLITKPVDLEKLTDEILAVCAERPVAQTGVRRRSGLRRSPMHAVTAELERFKDVASSILIQGETGTGKTQLAKWLHDASRREPKRFVDLNCAGFSRDLVEAELFGYERGAFTSAHVAKPGMFELADGGTLFLDEIGDLDLAVQPKVLKAIEEKRFRRMGGTREISVDVRIVAATHRDLRAAMRAGSFRADLYYRISTVTVTVPPLRERPDDIPELASAILVEAATRAGREPPELTEAAVAALLAHGWPGNIRELKNVLERSVHRQARASIDAEDLELDAETGGTTAAEVQPAPMNLRDLERVQIERALAAYGHVADAARSLGISRSGMYAKAKAYGLLPARRRKNG